MGSDLKYVNLANLHYLTEGLTFRIKRCAEVLDAALQEFNSKTRIPDKIVSWNANGGNRIKPLSFPGYDRIIVEVTEALHPEKGIISSAAVLTKKDEKSTAPVLFLKMRSLTLDIPMRVEIPLRAIMKGSPKLRNTYSVYLHALLTDDGKDYVYYGITSRGWSIRFSEHTQAAVGQKSRRLFPSKLNELIEARIAEMKTEVEPRQKLAGIISAICAVGLNEDSAMDTEEYLVDKYSLSSKHLNGLNMIPGGRAGIAALRRLSMENQLRSVETEEREELLEGYLQSHPQLGVPKPGIAEKWNDPQYAEAVICARENRLSAEQVREIRYLGAIGCSTSEIREKIEAIDDGQVQRVLAGRTYSRIF